MSSSASAPALASAAASSSAISVRLAFDPNKAHSTAKDFEQLAVYRTAPDESGRMKTVQVGFIEVLPLTPPRKDGMRLVPELRAYLSQEEKKEMMKQAEKMLPLLDRLWFVHNQERIAQDLARLDAVLGTMTTFPPATDDEGRLYRPLSRIAARYRKLRMGDPERGVPCYPTSWHVKYPDIDIRVQENPIFKVRWAFDDAGAAVPKSTQKKIEKLLGDLKATKEREARFYRQFIERERKKQS